MPDPSAIPRSEPREVPAGLGPLEPRPIRRVCVYCGASRGTDPVYAETARQLGAALAHAGLELVYGGGTDGLMGVVAQAVITHGGRVTGIIPTFLTHRCGPALVGSHDLVVVDHMHARKQAMFDKADAFIALPGGVGTLEELVEQMTWLKLGQHAKPLVIADIQGFWHPLLDLLDHMSACGFLRTDGPAPYRVCGSVDEILAALGRRPDAPVAADSPIRMATALLVDHAEITGSWLAPSRYDVYCVDEGLPRG